MSNIGIKLNSGRGEFLKSVSEYTSDGNLKPLLFDTISEAELYAQNHEIRNYTIETWTPPAKGPLLFG